MDLKYLFDGILDQDDKGDCKEHPESSLAYNEKTRQMQCNTCIFENNSDSILFCKYLGKEMKEVFEEKIQNYKESLSGMADVSLDSLSKVLENIIYEHFKTVQQRMYIMEKKVMKALDESSDLSNLEEIVRDMATISVHEAPGEEVISNAKYALMKAKKSLKNLCPEEEKKESPDLEKISKPALNKNGQEILGKIYGLVDTVIREQTPVPFEDYDEMKVEIDEIMKKRSIDFEEMLAEDSKTDSEPVFKPNSQTREYPDPKKIQFSSQSSDSSEGGNPKSEEAPILEKEDLDLGFEDLKAKISAEIEEDETKELVKKHETKKKIRIEASKQRVEERVRQKRKENGKMEIITQDDRDSFIEEIENLHTQDRESHHSQDILEQIDSNQVKKRDLKAESKESEGCNLNVFNPEHKIESYVKEKEKLEEIGDIDFTEPIKFDPKEEERKKLGLFKTYPDEYKDPFEQQSQESENDTNQQPGKYCGMYKPIYHNYKYLCTTMQRKLYKVDQNTYTKSHVLNYPSLYLSKTVMTPDGQIFVIGGATDENLCIVTDKVTQLEIGPGDGITSTLQKSMNWARSSFGCTLSRDAKSIFVAGGYKRRYCSFDRCEMYDITNNIWIPLPPIHEPLANTSLCHFVSLADKREYLYCFGGLFADYKDDKEWLSLSRKIEKLDLTSLNTVDPQWEMIRLELHKPICDIGCFQFAENKILIYGGWDSEPDDDMYLYKPDTDNKISELDTTLSFPDFFLCNGVVSSEIADTGKIVYKIIGQRYLHTIDSSSRKITSVFLQ